MKEIRPIHIIDEEIKQQAQNEAQKILDQSDLQCREISEDYSSRLNQELKEKEDYFNQKANSYQNNLNAKITLEQKRYNALFIRNSIINAINDFLEAMPEEKRLQIVMKAVSTGKNVFKDKEINVFVYGFNEEAVLEELKKLFQKQIVSCTKVLFNQKVHEIDIGLKFNEGIIIETTDTFILGRFTLCEIIGKLLDKKTYKLASILFGEGVFDA
ncbi:MAG: hypothetical protein IKX23_08185 [Treponema sp.]|nr:hypothetical protein [Treponema sp.]